MALDKIMQVGREPQASTGVQSDTLQGEANFTAADYSDDDYYSDITFTSMRKVIAAAYLVQGKGATGSITLTNGSVGFYLDGNLIATVKLVEIGADAAANAFTVNELMPLDLVLNGGTHQLHINVTAGGVATGTSDYQIPVKFTIFSIPY